MEVCDDELLSTPKITTFLANSIPKLHEPSASNAISQPLSINLLLIGFLSNLNVPNKQFFSGKLLVGLYGQLFINLFYKLNEEELFCTKTELLNFKITLLSAKLDMFGSRLVSKVLISSDDILVDIQLVTFLLLSNVSELRIGAKTKKF